MISEIFLLLQCAAAGSARCMKQTLWSSADHALAHVRPRQIFTRTLSKNGRKCDHFGRSLEPCIIFEKALSQLFVIKPKIKPVFRKLNPTICVTSHTSIHEQPLPTEYHQHQDSYIYQSVKSSIVRDVKQCLEWRVMAWKTVVSFFFSSPSTGFNVITLSDTSSAGSSKTNLTSLLLGVW